MIVKTVETFCQTSRDGVIGWGGQVTGRARPPILPASFPATRRDRTDVASVYGAVDDAARKQREPNSSKSAHDDLFIMIVAHDTARTRARMHCCLPSPPLHPPSARPIKMQCEGPFCLRSQKCQGALGQSQYKSMLRMLLSLLSCRALKLNFIHC